MVTPIACVVAAINVLMAVVFFRFDVPVVATSLVLVLFDVVAAKVISYYLNEE